ncbi:hypothetical protein HYPSUDRAFT_94502, partial [Hypholoma sublateritium FD-334 SS-4]
DQAAAKKILSDLARREDLANKVCADCQNPNPQWASLSFVRSISMDTWQDEQVRRMQLGGNRPFREFMRAYPADGGYKDGATPHATYHCWAAAQYRDKLDALLAGREWAPSPPTDAFTAGSRSASPAPQAQGLRKARAGTRGAQGSGASSPAPSRGSPIPDQKAANESYFATLGRANESRPADLPPSQGGRYTGFGSTPTPPPANNNPLSSANAPSLGELQENPVAALIKGWSLFAAAVAGASRAVSESVIQPGVERVSDPAFAASVRGIAVEATRRAGAVGGAANEWGKSQFGVDVADAVGGVVGTVKERVGGGPAGAGYGSVSLTSPGEEGSGLYDGPEDDDLFSEYQHGQS